MYVQSLSNRNVEDDPSVKAWRIAKQTAYLYMLVGSFLIYFLINVMIETLSLPAIHFVLPVDQARDGTSIQQRKATSQGPRSPFKSN